jgi:hypothetical protein
MEIKYTCSLGGMCHMSEILKRNNLKVCSYPFDWIFSNYDNIIHCIEDNFNIFLDKSYYNKINEGSCEHTYYYPKGCGLTMFNHYNPSDNIDHYNYYVRCVNRFKYLLKNQEHKLFTVIFINNNLNCLHNIIYNTVEFNKKLSKYTSNYTLLVIMQIPNNVENRHNLTHIDNIHFLELQTLSDSNGIYFLNNEDNNYLDNIIKTTYNFNL